jgi:hypothetical protein
MGGSGKRDCGEWGIGAPLARFSLPAPNLVPVSDGRAADGGVTADENWMKKEKLTSLPPAGPWFGIFLESAGTCVAATVFAATQLLAVSGQSIRRSDETLLAERSDGWGERSGGGAGRVGTWGKPVFRLAGLSAGRKSGAGAGGFDATGEHTSGDESQPARRAASEVWARLFAVSKSCHEKWTIN